MSDPARIWFYVSTRRWTCAVETDAWSPFTIRTTPPLLAAFIGGPLRDLVRWAERDREWYFVRIA